MSKILTASSSILFLLSKYIKDAKTSDCLFLWGIDSGQVSQLRRTVSLKKMSEILTAMTKSNLISQIIILWT